MSIFDNFKVTDEEYSILCKKFQNLCRFAAWQLIRKNIKNNYTDEIEDIEQDLLIAVIRAAVYYKRQIFIEKSLELAKRYAHDYFVQSLVEQLQELWNNRTKHGANKQKYGEPQEKILDCLVNALVPAKEQPDKSQALIIDKKFITYCKQIVWNQQKNLGKKITKERSIRSGMASLSTYDFLQPTEIEVGW